jgi:preprotein translocase SecE subunit
VQIYKEGHGVLVRRTAFFTLAGLVVWGGMSLYDGLVRFDVIKNAALSEYTIPVLGQRPDLAALICWTLVGVVCTWLFKALNREKAADYLIEADTEFQKITWPTWNDAFNSALVVLVFVVLMTLIIAIYDLVLSFILGKVL